MSFRRSTPQEINRIQSETFKKTLALLRKQRERAKGRRALVELRMSLEGLKTFSTIYSLPRIEARERGVEEAARVWHRGRRKKRVKVKKRTPGKQLRLLGLE